jgi:hypothetical protein
MMKSFSLLVILLVILTVLLPIGFVKATNWVEVAKFEGNRTSIDYTKPGIYTEPFTIDSYGWHIKWEYRPDIVGDHFEVYVYRQDEAANYIGHINSPQDGYSGTLHFYNETGTFYMRITFGLVESYSLVVEQNNDSLVSPKPSATTPSPTVPEFTQAAVIILVALVSLISIKLRKSRRLRYTLQSGMLWDRTTFSSPLP